MRAQRDLELRGLHCRRAESAAKLGRYFLRGDAIDVSRWGDVRLSDLELKNSHVGSAAP